jgi:hypothetical protein
MNIRICLFFVFTAAMSCAAEPQSFETSWITSKPEVLTYRSTGKGGDGLYQISLWKTADGIELYENMISPGFTKSVWGLLTADFHPRESKSRIVLSDQIIMTTECAYNPGSLHIATLMIPYNQVVENTLASPNLVIDFSQGPLLPRTLTLKPDAEFSFTSLNPQTNALVPLTIHVVGEETLNGVACFKADESNFEGHSTYWIEKTGTRRIMRIEQPGRVTELVLSPQASD